MTNLLMCALRTSFYLILFFPLQERKECIVYLIVPQIDDYDDIEDENQGSRQNRVEESASVERVQVAHQGRQV